LEEHKEINKDMPQMLFVIWNVQGGRRAYQFTY